MADSVPDARELDAIPVVAAERLVSLDVLRGVAVLGILVMNIYAFAMPFAAYMNPRVMGGQDSFNLGIWVATHILADQKFMSIFSMLFGAGIVLMMGRSEGKNQSFGRIFYRRQFWLLVFGLIHAYLIWFGDILFFYAVTGMLIYPLRHKSVRTLVVVSCSFLLVSICVTVGAGYAMTGLSDEASVLQERLDDGTALSDDEQAIVDEWQEIRRMIAPGSEEIQDDVVAHRGDYGGLLAYRIPEVAMFHAQALPFFVFWRVAAMMLLGMALMKLDVLSAARSPGTYRRMMFIAYGLGLPLTTFSAANGFAHGFDSLYMMRVGNVPNQVGSVLVALGHIALLMLLVQSGAFRRLLARFAAVGRMALSNYLMHSIVMTTIFYGYGLNQYTEIPRSGQMLLVVALIGLQLLVSPWWLARFRFGPAEWVWRSLTYWRPQPMRNET
jgi:uncharacterized protein